MKNLYHFALIDHFKSPFNKGVCENPNFTAKAENSSCGDHVVMQGIAKNQKITKLFFEGAGCVISQATASLITQYAQKMCFSDILNLTHKDVEELIKMPLGPVRLRCALLSLQALQDAVRDCSKD